MMDPRLHRWIYLDSALTGYSLWLVKSARSGDESAEQSDEEKPDVKRAPMGWR